MSQGSRLLEKPVNERHSFKENDELDALLLITELEEVTVRVDSSTGGSLGQN